MDPREGRAPAAATSVAGSREGVTERPVAWTSPLLYERLTWPEVRRAADEDRVCLIPAGTLEDHGPHLPIDCDIRIASEICRRAADAVPDDIVLLPPITHGFTPHHMEFPGPITIGWETFTKYCTDIGDSLARHVVVALPDAVRELDPVTARLPPLDPAQHVRAVEVWVRRRRHADRSALGQRRGEQRGLPMRVASTAHGVSLGSSRTGSGFSRSSRTNSMHSFTAASRRMWPLSALAFVASP